MYYLIGAIAIVYIAITVVVYRWLVPGQYASAFSRTELFVQCLFWPIGLAIILLVDFRHHFRSPDNNTRRFDELDEADPRRKR